MAIACKLASQIEERLLQRNQLCECFFSREAPHLAEACREMSLADFPVVVNCHYIPRIQEAQASIYHVMRESLEVLSRDEA